jgi:hypothetical protein
MYIGMADAGEAATAWPATWCYCFLEPKAVAYGDSLTPSSAWPKVVLLLELILCTGGLRSFVDPISYMTICFDCCTLSRPIVEVIEKNLITNVFC